MIDCWKDGGHHPPPAPDPDVSKCACVPQMPTRLRTLALHLGVHKHVNRHETSATSNAGHAVRVCAHRGCSTSHPENTLPALRAAVALGCEQVEYDVRLSADGRPVLMHDATVDRTTNGEGCVWQLSYEQLAALDASGGRPGFAGVRIPTLDEVLLAVPPSVEMNVHVNPGPTDCMALTRLVCAAVVRYGRLESCFVTGNEDVMEAALQYDSRVRRCMGSRPPAVYDQYRCYGIQPRNNLTDAALCEEAHAAGRLVWPFFANDEEEMLRLVESGVDGILTDVPEKLMALLRSRASNK